MSDQDNLRDRIAEIVNTALVEWNTDMDTQDSEGEYAAQAIIDELRLEREVSPINVDCVRYVSKWELRKH